MQPPADSRCSEGQTIQPARAEVPPRPEVLLPVLSLLPTTLHPSGKPTTHSGLKGGGHPHPVPHRAGAHCFSIRRGELTCPWVPGTRYRDGDCHGIVRELTLSLQGGQPDHSQRAPELGSESGLPHRGGVRSSAQPGSAWPLKRKKGLSRTAHRLARVTRAPRGLCWKPDIAKELPPPPPPAHLTLTHVSSHVCTYAHTPTHPHSHGHAPTHVPRLSPGSRH